MHVSFQIEGSVRVVSWRVLGLRDAVMKETEIVPDPGGVCSLVGRQTLNKELQLQSVVRKGEWKG